MRSVSLHSLPVLRVISAKVLAQAVAAGVLVVVDELMRHQASWGSDVPGWLMGPALVLLPALAGWMRREVNPAPSTFES